MVRRKNRHMVPVNEAGYRIGEGHPRVKFTDEEIDRIFEMREDRNMSYRCIAVEMGTSHSAVQSILTFRTRGQWPERFKRVDPRTHNEDEGS